MVARKYNDVPKKIKLQHCCFSETVYIMNKKKQQKKKMVYKNLYRRKRIGLCFIFFF